MRVFKSALAGRHQQTRKGWCAMAAKSKPAPVRMRLTVPAADVSVIEWLEQQDDVSGSVRALIRSSIERDGYTDVLNRPVEQLPRRGRPIGSSAGGSEDDEPGGASLEPSQPAQPRVATVRAEAQPEPEDAAAPAETQVAVETEATPAPLVEAPVVEDAAPADTPSEAPVQQPVSPVTQAPSAPAAKKSGGKSLNDLLNI